MAKISYAALALLCLTGALLGGNAWAQDKAASREREALRKAQQQMQQVKQEKAALEAKVAGVEQEKNQLAAEKAKLAGQVRGSQARAKEDAAKSKALLVERDALAQDKQALLTQKTSLEKQLADMSAKLANTEQQLTQIRAQKVQTDSNLTARVQQLASCEDKNAKLYTHGRDLIKQCTDRSATDTLLRLEPFTGIKRVGIENVLEEYRDKLDAEKLISADMPSK
jgi:chromosome segregation ATPase